MAGSALSRARQACDTFTHVFLAGSLIGVGVWAVVARGAEGLPKWLAPTLPVLPALAVLATPALALGLRAAGERQGLRTDMTFAIVGLGFGGALFTGAFWLVTPARAAALVAIMVAALWTVAAPLLTWADRGTIRRRDAAASLMRLASLGLLAAAFRYPEAVAGAEGGPRLAAGISVLLAYDAFTAAGLALGPPAGERLRRIWLAYPEEAPAALAEELEA